MKRCKSKNKPSHKGTVAQLARHTALAVGSSPAQPTKRLEPWNGCCVYTHNRPELIKVETLGNLKNHAPHAQELSLLTVSKRSSFHQALRRPSFCKPTLAEFGKMLSGMFGLDLFFAAPRAPFSFKILSQSFHGRDQIYILVAFTLLS